MTEHAPNPNRSASMRRIWRRLRKDPEAYRKRCHSAEPFVALVGRKIGNLRVLSLSARKLGNRMWLCESSCGHKLTVSATRLRGYGKKTCAECKKWSTRQYEYRGKHRNLLEWAKRLGISVERLVQRVRRKGFDQAMAQGNEQGSHLLTVGRTTHSMSEWARIRGVSRQLIDGRLRHRWSEKDAVMRPVGYILHERCGRPAKPIVFGGEERTVRQWAKFLGITPGAVRLRLYRGTPLSRDVVQGRPIRRKSA